MNSQKNYLIFLAVVLVSIIILVSTCLKDKNRADKTPPKITVLEPEISLTRGYVVVPVKSKLGEKIFVKGLVEDNKDKIRFVYVNGERTRVVDGFFETFVITPIGKKVIVIEATDFSDNFAKEKIPIGSNEIKEFRAEYKRAILIGNSNYTNGILNLKNPGNDVDVIGAKLKSLGFVTRVLKDLTYSDFVKQINRFKDGATTGSVNLVYYAGHGLQMDGFNFLIPTDATIPKSKKQLFKESISLSSIFESLEASNNVNIIILDACRDNPFPDLENVGKGLAPVGSPPLGTFIAFSADANQVALDGANMNSLYTESLLKNLNIPDLTIEEVFKRTRIDVTNETKGKQEPTEYSKLDKIFYFNKK